ncbi:hypothetical protein [Nitrosophilus labii]|uniref:hypothetical protein n=1 Tax=Nitrosophilus labii TaxID=2706014 RepID=UPI0016575483|nr:hypothetical protein [Nitrosophilus labii]
MSNSLPKNVEVLFEIEKNFNIIEKFKYKKSTVWINIKNYIYAQSLNIGFFIENKYKFEFKKLFFFVINSLKNLILSKREVVLFVGASSGILKIDGKVIDIYYPKDLIKDDILYFASADLIDRMYLHKEYFKNHRVIVHSFLFSPLRNIFAKILKKFIKLDIRDIKKYLKKNNFEIFDEQIRYIYAKFIVGYWIYKIVFEFFKIKKAYIVSAYSNTEIIAVLKEKGIEIIELQHGIIGEMHRGYNYKVKSPLLPTPNKILVYDEFWKSEILNAGYYDEKQIRIYPKYQYKLVKDIQIYDKPFIVFTGQGIKQKEIVLFLKDSINFLKKKDIYLLYLPHPTENFEFKIDNKYIKILNSKKFLTEQYIYSSIAHISIYSSCHFDAVHFHKKTYILDILDGNIMKYYNCKYPEKFIFIKNIEEIKI